MPFCCQCGNEVNAADTFCARCGVRQPSPQTPPAEFLGSMSSRTASLLCYIPVVGWIPAIVVLASTRFRSDREVRFHAFQGLYLFVAWLIVDWVVGPFFHFVPGHLMRFSVAGILKAAIFFTWIFMIIKTSQNETFRLPVFGELAERSVSEQK